MQGKRIFVIHCQILIGWSQEHKTKRVVLMICYVACVGLLPEDVLTPQLKKVKEWSEIFYRSRYLVHIGSGGDVFSKGE